MTTTTWIDRKYLNLVSSHLDRFVWKGNNIAQFRCPFCGDSQKNKYKSRGYVYEQKGSMFFKCHNCSMALPVAAVIKHLDKTIYREYRLECFKNDNHNSSGFLPMDTNSRPSLEIVSIDKLADKLSILDKKHYARNYIETIRKIPKKWLETLYYVRDFKDFINKLIPDNGKENLPSDPRIIIPFYINDKKEGSYPGAIYNYKSLIAVQGRALEADSKTRYITIKADVDSPKIWGLDFFDKSKPGFVVEGPFDGMHLDNTIATSGANLNEVRLYIDPDKHIMILDNEPRNKDICRIYKKVIAEGYKIVIWPDTIHEKDINDLILNGWNSGELNHLLNIQSFKGLRAELEFNQWRKCDYERR